MRRHALRRRYGRSLGLLPRGAFVDQRQMTAGEVNKELDRLDKLSSKITHAMIAGGRGHETWSQTAAKSPLEDDLTLAWQTVEGRRDDLRHEIRRRTGERMSRLPKGFGPIGGRRR